MYKYLIFTITLIFCSLNINIAKAEDKLLQEAIQKNDNELVEILMKYGHDHKYPALNYAMDSKDYRAVQILIECGADINSRQKNVRWDEDKDYKNYTEGFGATILEKAIDVGSLELIDYCLLKNANPNCFRLFKYYWCNHNSRYEFDQIKTTAIYEAIKKRNLEAMRLFYSYGADLSE